MAEQIQEAAWNVADVRNRRRLLSIIGPVYGWWSAGVALLSVSILATLGPIVFSFLGFVELNDPGKWLESADQLGSHRQRVEEHYSRIEGTLKFWKNKAAAYQRLHQARVVWSLVSAVSLPVLIQRYDKNDGWSVLFMTMLTTWTGLTVAWAYTFKAEEKFQGYRQQESDFYDTSRRLLDFAKTDDQVALSDQVDAYLKTVDEIRRVGRRVETGSPPSAL
jgi:hypothetical protein